MVKRRFKVGDRVQDCHPGLRILTGTLISEIESPNACCEVIYWCMMLDPPADVWVITTEDVLRYVNDLG